MLSVYWVVYYPVSFSYVSTSDWLSRPPPKWPKLIGFGSTHSLTYRTLWTVPIVSTACFKNITNLIWKTVTTWTDFNNFLHIAFSRILLQITILFYYWTSYELTLPCNISQWRKWRIAITSSVPQSVIDEAVDEWPTRLRACANWRLNAIILNICCRPLLISVVI